MSTPERVARPQVRRDARRIAGSAWQVRIQRKGSSPGAQDIVLLGGARAERLADRWRTATAFESFRERSFAHPTFADFADLGDAAIAVAVTRLGAPHEAGLWLDVLVEIVDEPPLTDSGGDISADVADWRRWARERNLLA